MGVGGQTVPFWAWLIRVTGGIFCVYMRLRCVREVVAFAQCYGYPFVCVALDWLAWLLSVGLDCVGGGCRGLVRWCWTD